MSELQHALDLFGLLSLEDVTAEKLKKSFKTQIIKAHPDKGGDDKIFDDMLHSYVYLSETVQRLSGGRATLQNIISPDEIKGLRVDEFINRFFEEFELEEFNRVFEEQNIKETHGYSTWLSSKDGEDNLMEGKFGSATQKPPTFEGKDFNMIFEQKAKAGKPEATALILHPEEMAYISGHCIGNEIIEANGEGYTSYLFTNPQYTDAYEAFSNYTICDKIPTFTPADKNFDDIIAERNKDITPLSNSELIAIQNFEKKKLEKSNKHFSNVKDFFKPSDGEQIINEGQRSLANWPPEKYSDDDYKGFRMDF